MCNMKGVLIVTNCGRRITTSSDPCSSVGMVSVSQFIIWSKPG